MLTRDVATLARLAGDAGRLGIDTEFLTERRYFPLLALVQIAVADASAESGIRVAILDPLTDLDAGPLAEVLADPNVEVILHAGRQDVALLRRIWQTEMRNVFDTQIAAAFLGLGGQVGYSRLVRAALGLEVGGGEAFTKWDERPLSEKQLAYAAEDVEHLLPLTDELQRRLSEAGRLEWAREECLWLESVSDLRDPEDAFRRLPKASALRREARNVAWELVRWRDAAARELDKPLGWLFPDRVLVDLAIRKPKSVADLERMRGMPEQTLRRRGRELLEVVERGREAKAPELPEPSRSDDRDAPIVSLAQAIVRQRALDHDIAPDLLATGSELSALVARHRDGDSRPVRLSEGWRRELVGADVLSLLAGERTLSVRDSQIRID